MLCHRVDILELVQRLHQPRIDGGAASRLELRQRLRDRGRILGAAQRQQHVRLGIEDDDRDQAFLVQQADRAERRLLGDVEAGGAAFIALHAAGAVEHECESDLWCVARHAARQRRYPFERRLVVAAGAKAVFAAEQQEPAAVVGHRLFEQRVDQFDDRTVVDDGALRELGLDVVVVRRVVERALDQLAS